MATLAEKQTELSEWKAALRALRLGRGYSVGDRSLNRVDLPEVQRHVAILAREVAELQAEADGADNPMIIQARWS